MSTASLDFTSCGPTGSAFESSELRSAPGIAMHPASAGFLGGLFWQVRG